MLINLSLAGSQLLELLNRLLDSRGDAEPQLSGQFCNAVLDVLLVNDDDRRQQQDHKSQLSQVPAEEGKSRLIHELNLVD